MIQKLHISNYALITSIDIQFQPGLNIITGETGAGKSIMLGALSLLLGGRADLKAIRDVSKKSVIEGVFLVDGTSMIRSICDENDIDWFDDQCILRRELAPNGRSRAFINDTPVTLQLLHDVAVHLIDIHSQHQNLLLADHNYQLAIIDTLAQNDELLAQYADAYGAYRAAARKFAETRDLIMRNRADAEFLTFQYEQLQEMNLVQGEQEDLERERDVLANMSQIKYYLSSAIELMTRNDSNVLESLASVSDDLQHLSDILPDADSLAERLESARLELKDISETLAGYDDDMNADPQALDRIEQRLSNIYSLEAKHHVENSDQLIALRDKLKSQLTTLGNADAELESLQEKAKTAKRAAAVIARQLSERRMQQAKDFAEELRQRAMPLGMSNLRCEIEVAQGKLTPTGFDSVDFKFAFNKNQPLMSVGNSASGGEISRLILSIKFVIAEKMQLPTIIFDEVDTGVSGDIAVRMAALMEKISNTSQVIAITHLPQVASKGATHFKVYKQDDDTSTNTHIRILSPDERIAEISLMLSGDANDPISRETAKKLLNNA